MLDDLVINVKAIRDDSKTYDPEDITEPGTDTPSIDIRLQIYDDGTWSFHSGDSSYDQDHRGYWGSSSVGPDDDDEACVEIAKNLLGDALEDMCMADGPDELVQELEKILA